jgi:hypothetical protein
MWNNFHISDDLYTVTQHNLKIPEDNKINPQIRKVFLLKIILKVDVCVFAKGDVKFISYQNNSLFSFALNTSASV